MFFCFFYTNHKNTFNNKYSNLPKIGPPSRISTTPFFEWSYCKGCFSLESMTVYLCHNTCSYDKKQWKSNTVHEEGLANEGRHHLLLLHKQALDKRGIAEPLHEYINRDRLYSCVWGGHIIKRNTINIENMPTPLLVELHSSPMGVFLGD